MVFRGMAGIWMVTPPLMSMEHLPNQEKTGEKSMWKPTKSEGLIPWN